MHDSKKGFVSFRVGISLSSYKCPKTLAEIERMREIFYASSVENLIYAILCTRPDICYVMGMVNRYQYDPSEE